MKKSKWELGINIRTVTRNAITGKGFRPDWSEVYYFDIFINNKRQDSGVIEKVDNMSDAIEWINEHIIVKLDEVM